MCESVYGRLPAGGAVGGGGVTRQQARRHCLSASCGLPSLALHAAASAGGGVADPRVPMLQGMREGEQEEGAGRVSMTL